MSQFRGACRPLSGARSAPYACQIGVATWLVRVPISERCAPPDEERNSGMPWLPIDPQFAVAGFLVGALVGVTGVGGGALMTPILIVLFGVSPATAVGTDLLFAAATKSVGSLVHGYNRTIDWTVVKRLAIGSMPATVLALLMLSTLHVA